MAVGKSSYFELDTSSASFKIRVYWSETYDASTNASVVTVDSVEFMSTGWYGFTYYPDGVVKINGETVITMNSRTGDHYCWAPRLNTWAPIVLTDTREIATGSVVVVHDADGRKSINIEIAGNRYSKCFFYVLGDKDIAGNGWNCAGFNTIELTEIPTYILSIDAGVGSRVTVSRTSSGYAPAGNISHGDRLYYNDRLKITFDPEDNYRLLTTNVNSSPFSSGNTHIVSGDVSIVAVAQILASKVGATDANIGSTSTIIVTKYSNNYYHSLQYSFGELSGYITSTGDAHDVETKFQNTSVAFSVPIDFFSQIPNAKNGVCTVTCRTYATEASADVLGSPSICTFIVTAHALSCEPKISASLIDVDEVTRVLTGDENILIRYRSNAQCSVTAEARHYSTVAAVSIAGSSVYDGAEPDVSASLTLFDTDQTSFLFAVTDSRGYTTTKTITPTVVPYVVLTCNPMIARKTPTGSTMVIQLSGNVFRGSFGAYSNTLTIQYRYKEDGGSYGPWKTIDPTKIIFGASNYRTNGQSELDDEFDYQKAYEFQIKATDGANGLVLTTAQRTVSVQRGVPVFDWGQNDFNVNADIRMFNISLLDIIYPVGSVYTSTNSTLPPALTTGGMTWEPMPQVGDVYYWKRVSVQLE